MKARVCFVAIALAASTVSLARAGLPVGATLAPYEVHNPVTGADFSPADAFRAKAATVAFYGRLNDPEFWADCHKLQDWQAANPNAGAFVQVIDAGNAALIAARARENGLTLPVVYAVDPDWKKAYRLQEGSRILYLSKNGRLEWSAVGLDDKTLAELTQRVKAGGGRR